MYLFENRFHFQINNKNKTLKSILRKNSYLNKSHVERVVNVKTVSEIFNKISEKIRE